MFRPFTESSTPVVENRLSRYAVFPRVVSDVSYLPYSHAPVIRSYTDGFVAYPLFDSVVVGYIPDFSQIVIRKRLIDYLTIAGNDPDLFRKARGLCQGLLTLRLCGFALTDLKAETGRLEPIEQADDAAWFDSVLFQLVTWDGKKETLRALTGTIERYGQLYHPDFDRFANLVIFFQEGHRFLGKAPSRIDIAAHTTTQGAPVHEFSFIAPLMPIELSDILKQIIFPGRMIFIANLNHVVGVYVKKDSSACCYYDSNNLIGAVISSNVDTLASLIFRDLFKTRSCDSDLRSGSDTLELRIHSYAFKPDERVYPDCHSFIALLSEDRDFYPAIYFASVVGDIRSLRVLLKHFRRMPREYPECCMPPLFSAAFYQPELVTDLLLSHPHIDPNEKSSDGDTPLLYAIYTEAFCVARRLILDSRTSLNLADACGVTPLMMSVEKKAYFLYEFMLKRGANLFVHNRDSKTVFDYAYDNGDLRRILNMTLKSIALKDEAEAVSLAIVTAHKNGNRVLEKNLREQYSYLFSSRISVRASCSTRGSFFARTTATPPLLTDSMPESVCSDAGVSLKKTP